MLCECTGCALYFEADLLADDEELACPLCGEPATEMSDERDMEQASALWPLIARSIANSQRPPRPPWHPPVDPF
jgi:hypothetical protein